MFLKIILNEIENSKKNSLEDLLFGLGIRYVGKKTAKIICARFKNMDKSRRTIK